MAARRLILVLVVLLAISIAAAAIAPDRRGILAGDEEPTGQTTDTTQEAAEPRPAPSGELVVEKVTADPAEPETIRASPGDQLELSVDSARPIQVEIRALGLIDEATPDAPAYFNVLLRETGQLAITDADSGEIVGRIVAGPAEDDKPDGKAPGKSEPDEPDEGAETAAVPV